MAFWVEDKSSAINIYTSSPHRIYIPLREQEWIDSSF